VIIASKGRNKMCGAEDIREREKWGGDENMKVHKKCHHCHYAQHFTLVRVSLQVHHCSRCLKYKYHGVSDLPCNFMPCWCTAVIGYLHSRMV
jgi:hypothetical protein